jgi:hypothetical protein
MTSSIPRAASTLLVLLASCHCTPRAGLVVQPLAYCPETPIHIAWDTVGETYLKISPQDGDFVPVATSGARDVPPAPMAVDLQAVRRDRREAAHAEVAPVATRPLVGDARDCDAGLAQISPIEIRAGDYDARTRLDSISSSCHSVDPSDPCPTITVCHGVDRADPCTGAGAHRWQIAPGERVDIASAGLDGFWLLARALTPSEHCHAAAGSDTATATATTPATSRMTHLRVQLNLSCAPRAEAP